jgi:uncharacterized protein YicC (UPF0701 family)
MSNKLTVVLDAEVDKFNADIKKSSDRIDVLKGRIQTLKQLKLVNPDDTKEQARLNTLLNRTNVELSGQRLALGRTKSELKSYSATANQASASVGKLSKAQQQFRNQAGSSNAVALEFNRIIQDAPFGILGVGNNIQQLAGNFSNLTASGLTAGQAISTALTSIISPANLVVLGISAVTSLWTAYSMGAFDSAEETDDLTESLDDLIDKLTELELVAYKASVSFDQDKIKTEALAKVVNDFNLTADTRLKAYQELKDQFPTITKGLSDETVLANGLGDAYDEITRSLLAQANAKANLDVLSDTIGEQNKLIAERISFEGKSIIIQEKLQKARAQLARTTELVNSGEIKGTKTLKENQKVVDDYIELLNLYNEKLNDNQTATTSNSATQELLKEAYVNNIITLQDYVSLKEDESDEDERSIKIKRTEIKALDRLFQTREKLAKQLRDTYNDRKNFLENDGKVFSGQELLDQAVNDAKSKGITLFKPFGELSDLEIYFQQVMDLFKSYGNEIEFVQLDFLKNLNSNIRGNLEDALVGIGDSLGDALISGENVIKALGGSLLDSIGAFLGDLGQQLIAYGVAGIAFTKLTEAIKAGGALAIPAGIGAIGAGVALVAIGSAFRSRAGAGIGGSGGGGGGASGAVAGNSGQSFTGGGLAFQGFGDLELSSSIRGTDLVLLINRAGNVNN